MPIESILQFPNPNAPDLGCFIKRKHEFELNEGFQNVHVEFNPSIDFSPKYHQVYFRVLCGHAAFFQRCLVYMTTDATIPPPILAAFPPDWILGGDYTPRPSEWYRYPTQSGSRIYWFIAQHRNPSETNWLADAAGGHSYDIYENGTLSTVKFDDTGGDRDFNDFILEVAVVGRKSWADVLQAENQAEVNQLFFKEGLPKLKKRLIK